eukprot:1325567-Pyramimonas_sp.AAC.1
MAASTCVSPPTQHSASGPHGGLHLRSQRRCPHASPWPSTALRGPTRNCGTPPKVAAAVTTSVSPT